MSRPPWKLRLIQAYRLAVLLGIVWLLHAQHSWREARREAAPLDFSEVAGFFPEGVGFGPVNSGDDSRPVLDRRERGIGIVIQTSPRSDAIVGYSGPTNLLLAFDDSERIVGAKILRSGDTPDHVEMILKDPGFLESYIGRSWDELAETAPPDGVSGATLTSLAIREAVQYRLTGERPNLRFPEKIALEEARKVFPGAGRLEPERNRPEMVRVLNPDGVLLGRLLRTAHLADEIMGYQGPTDVLVALNEGGDTVAAVRIRSSYDTRDYVQDVKFDDLFLKKFEGKPVAELAAIDRLEDAGIEGVSGATMTSLAMARGIRDTMREMLHEEPALAVRRLRVTARDAGLAAIVLLGILMAFSDLHSSKLARRLFQVVLVVYLGFINGDMVAQALLLGWAQSGVAWSTALGLVLLVAAAFIVPAATGRQVYCHHICPHGAAQQLIMKWRRGRRIHVPRRIARWLEKVPGALLFFVLVVGMSGIAIDLAGIEPFDAYIVRAAGWATVAVAVVGLALSWFVPMGYCRFGCPTGKLLEFVRYRRGAEHFGRRELIAGLFLLAAMVLYWQKEMLFG